MTKQQDTLLSLANHKVKSLLTSIKAYDQLLQKRLQNNEQTLSFVKRLDTQVDALTLLITNLLDIYRVQEQALILQKEFIDATTVVQEVVVRMQKTTQQPIFLQGTLHKKLFADKQRFIQILSILLTNAIQHTHGTKQITVTVVEEKDACTVSVQDTGEGIPRETREHLFDLVYQEKLQTGLSLAKAIIDLHHGTLDITSVAGKGSTFSFHLPIE
ncbi:MAG TPA: HAMP domain-containing sensor histidine kinase [Patescibacteria group bacterium]|nr:HAMP domain-containing sensor histidine kinase [Patescibacteria group bacterium]